MNIFGTMLLIRCTEWLSMNQNLFSKKYHLSNWCFFTGAFFAVLSRQLKLRPISWRTSSEQCYLLDTLNGNGVVWNKFCFQKSFISQMHNDILCSFVKAAEQRKTIYSSCLHSCLFQYICGKIQNFVRSELMCNCLFLSVQ